MFHLTTATRCEALFASDVQASQHPDSRQVSAAIAQVIDKFGVEFCLARVAQEFGDHPETAAARMHWAKQAVRLAA